MTFTTKQMVWVSVGFVLLLVCSSGCSSSKPRASTPTASAGKGTVTGTLHLAGGPAPGTNKPAAGEVYVFTSASLTGTPTAKATTAPDGSFSLALSPGTYYLAATSPSFTIDPPPAAPPCHGNTPAVVSPGSTSKVDVVCEMK